MILTSKNNNIADLRSAADIIDETAGGLITYLGFCEKGTETTAEQKWSIMKIEQSSATPPAITTFKWANGLAAFNLSWNNRTGYDYKFKKF